MYKICYNIHMSTEKIFKLVNMIADIGREHPLSPPLSEIKPFSHFRAADGKIDVALLDERDGGCTRRELILRFLLLCAVLDQGPDIVGVRKLLTEVVNGFYDNEIRIFHTPLEFFKEMDVSVDKIWKSHEEIKMLRQDEWARINQSTTGKYNLFMDGAKQTLSYAIFRWGTPLALPYLLVRKSEESKQKTALIDYLEISDSAEQMSQRIKDDPIYGLGKAIGDKACHLFAKWMVSTFSLTRRTDKGWGRYSYEVPYDSNAGRVLWRTGYFLNLCNKQDYEKNQVIQPGAGKGGLAYIRVTNIRGMNVRSELPDEVLEAYHKICIDHLKTHKRGPKKIEVQRLQHAFLLLSQKSIAEFDDGLIYIGKQYCHNHENPNCHACPLKKQCVGFNERKDLIKGYRT